MKKVFHEIDYLLHIRISAYPDTYLNHAYQGPHLICLIDPLK